VRFSGTVLESGTEIIGGAAFLQDLREIKKLEKERLANERLVVVGQTVAQLSHGMKNILTGVQAGLYGIKAGIKRNDVDRLNVGRERLERNVNRITDLVRGFLKYSKEHSPQIVPTNLNQIAEEVHLLYQDVATNRGIDLRIEKSPDVEPAQVDPKDMHTCLANLVSNAIDACTERGPDAEDSEVIIRVSETPESHVLKVIDNGCGMDEQTKNKVFTTFFTTKGLEGTGLGLLVTRKLARANGGDVRVNSEPGRGSEFLLEFPKPGAIPERA
jgi:signal transduction histidine kinase